MAQGFDVVGARKAGHSDDAIAAHLKKLGYGDGDIKIAMGLEPPARGKVNFELPKETPVVVNDTQGNKDRGIAERYKSNTSLYKEDILAKAGSYARTGASAAVGIIAGIRSGPAAGNVAMAGTDQLLRKVTGEKTGGVLGITNSTLGGTIEDSLVGEVGGRVISKVAKTGKAAVNAAREYFRPGSVVDPALSSLNPPYSGFFKSAPKSTFIEDTLASERKAGMLEETNKIATTQAEALIKKVSKRTTTLASSSEKLAQDAEGRIITQFDQSVKASNAKAQAANLIAKANIQQIQVLKTPATTATVNGVTTTLVPAVYEPVDIIGPVNLETTILKAKQYVDEFKKGLVGGDPDNPLFRTAKNILDTTGAKFDSVGNLESYNPIDFDQAWQWKKQAGEYAYGSPYTDMKIVDAKFKPLFSSIDTDIENSMGSWAVDGTQAQQLYQNTKALVNQRHELFNPGGMAGRNTTVLLNNLDQSDKVIDSPVQNIYRIIDDPAKLQRALNIGQLNFGTGPKIVTSNLKKDLQAVQLKRLFNDSIDINQFGEKDYNLQKLYQAWSNNEASDSYKILYNSKQRGDMEQFFKNLSYASKAAEHGASHYLKLRAGTAAVAFTGGLIGYAVTGSASTAGLITSGGIAAGVLTLNALAKVMTGPHARILVAASQGGPLNMSTELASRLIMQSLIGQEMTIETKDGKGIPGKIGPDGKFIPNLSEEK